MTSLKNAPSSPLKKESRNLNGFVELYPMRMLLASLEKIFMKNYLVMKMVELLEKTFLEKTVQVLQNPRTLTTIGYTIILPGC